MYRNSEGYADPTAGAALSRMMKEFRQEQKRRWRPGCGSCESENPAVALAARIRKVVASAAVALADERRLEVELTLVDGYGVPWWKAFGRFGGEWRELTAGVWKDPEMKAAFAVRATFRSATMPDAVRLEQHGFGEAHLRYVSVADRHCRRVPAAVTATSGRVKDAANVLTDDYSATTFGTAGYLEAFYDKAKQEAVSSVTIELKDE